MSNASQTIHVEGVAKRITFATSRQWMSPNCVNEVAENIEEKKLPENVKNVLKNEDRVNPILNVVLQRNILVMQNKMELHQNASEEIISQKYERDIKNVQKKVRRVLLVFCEIEVDKTFFHADELECNCTTQKYICTLF